MKLKRKKQKTSELQKIGKYSKFIQNLLSYFRQLSDKKEMTEKQKAKQKRTTTNRERKKKKKLGLIFVCCKTA